jgi:hypothetical protein
MLMPRSIMSSIRTEITGGFPSETTKRRWDNIFRYVLNAGTFPVAPVVMRRPERLIGCVSALQLMPQQKLVDLGLTKPALEQDVWIGTHNDGELPNAQ